MSHRIHRLIPALFIIGVAIVTIAQPHPASAHGETTASQAITLTPASTELKINPGDSASKTVDIINSGHDSFGVKITSSPYHISGVDYDPKFTQLPGTVDASQWVSLSKTSASVDGGKVLTVPYTVTVPKGTAPGGYYAVVFAETSADDSKTGVVSHNRVGNILYITVNGDIKSSGDLTGGTIPSFSFGGPVPITTKISNTGGSHFITKAVYSVVSMTGDEVFKSSTERYILPQTEREITETWSPRPLFGIFTVHRSATINGEIKTLPDQKIVIISPWVIIAALFLIGILLGVPYHRARRRRRSKEK